MWKFSGVGAAFPERFNAGNKFWAVESPVYWGQELQSPAWPPSHWTVSALSSSFWYTQKEWVSLLCAKVTFDPVEFWRTILPSQVQSALVNGNGGFLDLATPERRTYAVFASGSIISTLPHRPGEVGRSSGLSLSPTQTCLLWGKSLTVCWRQSLRSCQREKYVNYKLEWGVCVLNPATLQSPDQMLPVMNGVRLESWSSSVTPLLLGIRHHGPFPLLAQFP